MTQETVKTNLLKNEKFKDYSDCDSEQSDEETNISRDINVSQYLLEEISSILNSIVKQNKKKKNPKDIDKIFIHGQTPQISIFDYLCRIQKYSLIENSTLIISLIYIDRICKEKGFILTKNNIHRILFISIYTAIKYNEDKIYKNKFYAKIAGISVKELTKLESGFLNLIEFKLFVSDEIYQVYSSFLESINKQTKY